MPGTDDYPLNHNELSAASLKIQAVLRGRHERSQVRKKRAALVYQREISQANKGKEESTKESTKESTGQHHQGNWVEAWDPHERCNYYYNIETEETSWEPPSDWTTDYTVSTDLTQPNNDENGYGRGRTGGVAPSLQTSFQSKTLDHVERTATGPQRAAAATLIQNQARSLMARREVNALKEVKRIKLLRNGGLPPDEDFREAGKKLRSEIKQSRRLVAMKEKRIEQLEQGMEDRKLENELRKAEMMSLQKKLELDRDEIKILEKAKENNTVKIKEYMNIVINKDKKIESQLKELSELKDLLAQSKKMIQRRDEQIKRKDTLISNMKPETEDVCLSARSFSENMMINLRDQAIDAKEEQLALLNSQNEDLNENITRVESEVEKMQKDLLAKDDEITVKRKKITHLTNNIDRLERELQKKGGEEAAIELTNKQNANLLVLLQQHEAKTESLEDVRSVSLIIEQLFHVIF